MLVMNMPGDRAFTPVNVKALTRVMVTGVLATATTSGGRMRGSGRGSARLAKTVSPDSARPAPAGQRYGRTTAICKPAIAIAHARIARTTTRGDESEEGSVT